MPAHPRRRIAAAAAVAAAVLAAVACAGCAAEAGSGDAPGAAGPANGAPLTAARLESALLPRIDGYTPFGEPESGEYGSLRAVQQGRRLQQAATLDKPECARVTPGFADDARVQRAPAASVAFARSAGLTVHEMLIALPPDIANDHLDYRVPRSCRRYRARIDGQSFTYRVVERDSGDAGTGIGDASRTVGVAVTTAAGGSGGPRHTKIWHVAFRGGGYVGFITLSGARADRARAEQLARAAFEQVERSLP